jgi:glutamine amidotransferase
VALLDYGVSNLVSVEKALAHVGFRVLRTRAAREIDSCGGVVIPGVGHFAATQLLRHGFADALERCVARGTPLLGVCLGLQFFFEGSDEAPGVPGLGLLSGQCFRLAGGEVKVPHVGWNGLEPTRPSRLLQGIGGACVYFTHSYAAPVTSATVATTTHGASFASVVESGNVFGVQWHPEKSGEAGLALLRNFAEIVSSC